MGKIQVGYGTGGRGKSPKNSYAGRSKGKLIHNGGFNGEPTVSFDTVEQKDWDQIFPDGFKPSWENNA